MLGYLWWRKLGKEFQQVQTVTVRDRLGYVRLGYLWWRNLGKEEE